MDRAIDTTAPRERGIGGVHDRVHGLLGNITLCEFQQMDAKLRFHGLVPRDFPEPGRHQWNTGDNSATINNSRLLT